MPDDVAEACAVLRQAQLDALRELWKINRQLLAPAQELTVSLASVLVDRFILTVDHLKELDGIVSDYRENGLLPEQSFAETLVNLRWKRVTRGIDRVQQRLDDLHQKMPTRVPELRLMSDGRIARSDIDDMATKE